MHRPVVLGMLAVATLQGAANGAAYFLDWESVNNRFGNPGADAFAGAAWSALDQYTFDLFLHGPPGERIIGIHMGDADNPGASPNALHTNGMIFNHPLTGDVQSPIAFPPFNAAAYDTFVDLGGALDTPPISFAGGVDLAADGAVDTTMRATWFTSEAESLDASGGMRIMRITVGFPVGFNVGDPLHGGYVGTPRFQPNAPVSWLQVETAGGERLTLWISNPLDPLSPAPGAAALFGLSGAAAMRRRR